MSDIIHVMVSKNYEDEFTNFIESLQLYTSNFKIHLVELGRLTVDLPDIENIVITDNWEDRILQIRMTSLLDFNYEVGDRVLVLDIDLLFKCNPFEIFDIFKRGDVFLSSRNYKSLYPIIGCFWGFIWNEKTKELLQHFKENSIKPTWGAVNHLRKKWGHNNTSWWIDQDLLCALYTKGFKNIKVKDIGWHYSYDMKVKRKNITKHEKAVQLFSAKVLHFKQSNNLRLKK